MTSADIIAAIASRECSVVSKAGDAPQRVTTGAQSLLVSYRSCRDHHILVMSLEPSGKQPLAAHAPMAVSRTSRLCFGNQLPIRRGVFL